MNELCALIYVQIWFVLHFNFCSDGNCYIHLKCTPLLSARPESDVEQSLSDRKTVNSWIFKNRTRFVFIVIAVLMLLLLVIVCCVIYAHSRAMYTIQPCHIVHAAALVWCSDILNVLAGPFKHRFPELVCIVRPTGCMNSMCFMQPVVFMN